MSRALELFQYPFQPHCLSLASGHRLSYLDEGAGPVLVFVHGNPTWSYFYRNLVRGLRDSYRCIAPDHLGCGLSDKPREYPYRLTDHIENLEELLAHLGVTDCVLVMHDWGGAIGMGWAGRHPDRVKGLVVMNTAAFRSTRMPLRIAVCRQPLLGPLLVRGLNGFARAAVRMAVAKPMAPEVAQGFLYPYRSWADRVAVLRFVEDIPLDPSHPSWPTLCAVEENLDRLAEKPMLICWGGRDFCFNDSFFEEWRRRFPGAESLYLPDAGHYLLEDGLEPVRNRVKEFLASLVRDEEHKG